MAELDPAILRAVRGGERAALEQLARHFAAPVYRYLVRLCGDAVLAEDLAQDVAIQMWRHLPGRTFPNQKALTSWVYTVATNAFRMHHRRVRPQETALECGAELPAGPDSDPKQCAERKELAARVRAAVELLPDPERQMLLLKVFGEMKYGEISACFGEPVGTVKWRISKAYARLRELLASEMRSGEIEDEPLLESAVLPGRGGRTPAAMAYAAPSRSVSSVLRARQG